MGIRIFGSKWDFGSGFGFRGRGGGFIIGLFTFVWGGTGSGGCSVFSGVV